MLDVIGQEIVIGDFAATSRRGAQIEVYEVIGTTNVKVRLRRYGSTSTFTKYANEIAIIPGAENFIQ